MNRAIAGL